MSKPLDTGLEFVGSDRPGVEFFAAYFVRLPGGQVLSVDEADLPDDWQHGKTLATGVNHCRRDSSMIDTKDLEPGDEGPTLEELAAALQRRGARQRATATRAKASP